MSVSDLVSNEVPDGEDVVLNDANGAEPTHEEDDSEQFVEMMSFPEQKKFIQDCINKTLVAGDMWYLLNVHWYKQWKKYVDCATNGKDVEEEEHPGPIDNLPLLEIGSEKLKEHLLEGADYKVISARGWEKLVELFNLAERQNPIARNVIESGKYTKETKVEVYLVELKLATFKDLDNVVVKEFSKATNLESVVETMKSIFNIPEDEKVRLWNKYLEKTYEQIVKLDTALQDFGVGSGQMLVLEQKNDKNEWTRQTRSRSLSGSSSLTPTSSSNDPPFSSGSIFSSPSGYSSGGYSQYGSKHKAVKKGLCGLGNLGNTCFMNSSLQCLSNTTPLRNHFLSGTYKHELNPTNPLGMHGKIAEAYADLQNQMWNGQHDYIAPRHFKMQVGRFAPQFSGYQQQDSQELLAFLLDGLHEDLNRVKQKPYIELKDDKGRPDEVLAKEAWANHTRRNSSVITDNFHGLFKSTVECPVCEKRSITFDPFCYLSLPLPIKKERWLQITFVPEVPTKKPLKMKVVVPINGRISDLSKAVAKLTGSDPSKLFVADVFHSKFHKRYERNENISQIADRDDIYVYESPFSLNDPHLAMIPVYLREIKKSNTYSYSYSSNSLFGKPLMVPVPKDSITASDLYQKILQWMKRYVTAPTIEDEIDEAMSTTEDNDNQDVLMSEDEEDSDLDEPVKKDTPQQQEEDQEGKSDNPKLSIPSTLFEIKIINNAGSTDLRHLSYDDDERLKLSPKTHLAIDWYPKLKKVYYDENIAKEYEEHPSLKELPTKKTVNLNDCLELFLQREQLGEEDPWYCPKCKEHRQAYKKFDLWSLPKILVFHLKRFSYNRAWRDKLDALVNFPLRELELTEYVIDKSHPRAVYDLHAVSNHYGGLGGGHYTAYAVNWYDAQWYYFDDSSVSSADTKSPVSKAAYVLFYTRREDPDVDIWSTNDLLTEDGMDDD